MNDPSTLVDSKEPRLSRFSPVAIVLILIAFVGAYVSAGYSHTLSDLLQEQLEFNESFGAMNVEDPSRVAIVAASPTATDLPAWVDPEDIWLFRVHIPASYGVSLTENEGLIAVDSPLSYRGGGGSTSSSGKPEAKEVQIIISASIEDGRVKGWMLTDSSTMTFALPKKLAVTSLDELVLDTIVKPGQPMQTFAIDEAICVWKIRSKNPSKKKLNHTNLYSGCAIYLYETSQRNAFESLVRGKSSSMADSKP